MPVVFLHANLCTHFPDVRRAITRFTIRDSKRYFDLRTCAVLVLLALCAGYQRTSLPNSVKLNRSRVFVTFENCMLKRVCSVQSLCAITAGDFDSVIYGHCFLFEYVCDLSEGPIPQSSLFD